MSDIFLCARDAQLNGVPVLEYRRKVNFRQRYNCQFERTGALQPAGHWGSTCLFYEQEPQSGMQGDVRHRSNNQLI
jgi:hypothetical protein